MRRSREISRTLVFVIGGPVCAWVTDSRVIPDGQPGTNSAFVLAVLIAVIVAGQWWRIVAACISTGRIDLDVPDY